MFNSFSRMKQLGALPLPPRPPHLPTAEWDAASLQASPRLGSARLALKSWDGAALTSHQCGLGLIPAQCLTWVEFVAGSRPCSECFSRGSPVFLPPQEPTSPNSNSTRIEDPH